MFDTVQALPHGANTAFVGLSDAIGRLHGVLCDGLSSRSIPRVGCSLSESLFWVAVLDDFASKTVSNYYEQREARGAVVGGLVYARNFHVHELMPTSQMLLKWERAVHPDYGPLTAVRDFDYRFATFAELPEPRHVERHGRDEMYESHVELRPLYEPIEKALSWLQFRIPFKVR